MKLRAFFSVVTTLLAIGAVSACVPATPAPGPDQTGVPVKKAGALAKAERKSHPSKTFVVDEHTLEFWKIKRNGYDFGVLEVVDLAGIGLLTFDRSKSVPWIKRETGCDVPQTMLARRVWMEQGDKVVMELTCNS